VAPPANPAGAPTPIPVDKLRQALSGATGQTDEQLAEYIDIALGHIVPNLALEYRPDEAGDYPPWPADLTDGCLLAAMLTARNREAPSAATTEGGYASVAQYGVPTPSVPPVAWDPRVRHRLLRFMDPGGMVG
jgi:hypothetical protein